MAVDFSGGADGRVYWSNVLSLDGQYTSISWWEYQTAGGTWNGERLAYGQALGSGAGEQRILIAGHADSTQWGCTLTGAGGWWDFDCLRTSNLNVWRHYLVTHDQGSINNDPILYLNGVEIGLRAEGAHSGAFVYGADTLVVANRLFAADQAPDSYLAEMAIWKGGILFLADAKALANRITIPFEVDPTNLNFYAPLYNDTAEFDRITGLAATIDGTTATVAHPPVPQAIIPVPLVYPAPTVAAPGLGLPAGSLSMMGVGR